MDLSWEGMGIPKKVLPAPPPFLPVPRGLIVGMEGLDEWEVYTLRGTQMQSVGTVFAETREEAEEAAENSYGGDEARAIEVVRK